MDVCPQISLFSSISQNNPLKKIIVMCAQHFLYPLADFYMASTLVNHKDHCTKNVFASFSWGLCSHTFWPIYKIGIPGSLHSSAFHLQGASILFSTLVPRCSRLLFPHTLDNIIPFSLYINILAITIKMDTIRLCCFSFVFPW